MARGNQALPDAIAASLPDVRLGHRVRAVVHDPAGVRVQVEGEVELSGVAAVVALPARVASGMRFDPFLPDDLATALYELPMGVGVQARGSRRRGADTSRGPERGAPVLVLDRERG